MTHRNFMGAGLAALLLAAPAAQAAMSVAPPPSASNLRMTAAACSFGYHLDISGTCVDSMDYSRHCPPGYFPISYPNGDGYRCLPAEWQRSGSWLMDLF